MGWRIVIQNRIPIYIRQKQRNSIVVTIIPLEFTGVPFSVALSHENCWATDVTISMHAAVSHTHAAQQQCGCFSLIREDVFNWKQKRKQHNRLWQYCLSFFNSGSCSATETHCDGSKTREACVCVCVCVCVWAGGVRDNNVSLHSDGGSVLPCSHIARRRQWTQVLSQSWLFATQQHSGPASVYSLCTSVELCSSDVHYQLLLSVDFPSLLWIMTQQWMKYIVHYFLRWTNSSSSSSAKL